MARRTLLMHGAYTSIEIETSAPQRRLDVRGSWGSSSPREIVEIQLAPSPPRAAESGEERWKMFDVIYFRRKPR